MSQKNTNLTERIGVHKVALAFLEEFGWFVREQAVSDVGIDMQAEIVKEDKPTGQLFSLQIKSGNSYFKESKEDFFIYRGEKKHLEYWTEHSTPVLIIVYSSETKNIYWQKVLHENICKTEKGWKINIPYTQTLTKEFKADISKIYNNPNHYTEMNISDTSHGVARRASIKILVEHTYATSKTSMREMIPKLNKKYRVSDYHRDEATRKHFKDQFVEIIEIFFYDSIQQFNYGLPFCRTIWNAASCKAKIDSSDSTEFVDSIGIIWEENNLLADFIAENQCSKGEFLDFSDKFYNSCKEIYTDINENNAKYINDSDNELLKKAILKWENKVNEMDIYISEKDLPPNECIALNEIIKCSVAMLGNILLAAKKTSTPRLHFIIKSDLKEINTKLPHYEYERRKM